MGLATTVLRLVTGATMAGHGIQKLTGSLGGHGPEATGQAFHEMGFRPGRQFAMATGIAETAGGTMMALGLATPMACSMVTGVMVGAIAKVHLKNGFWVTNGGFEYNLHILASTFVIAEAGGGALTLDGLRGKKHKGFRWGLAQLVVGAGAAMAAMALSERQAGDQWQQSEPSPATTTTPGQASHEGSDTADLADDSHVSGRAGGSQ